jgi:hypothetical protein
MQPAAEKELSKESLYNDKVQNILQKHKRLILGSNTYGSNNENGDPAAININQYASERAIIDRVIANQSNAVLGGVALAGLAFTSLRFFPRTMIARLNPEKLTKLHEIEAKKGWIQKSVVFIFEAALSGLVGWRVGYTKISSQNENSYDEIAKIPLCAGRSIVSDKTCPDMINLVHREIPRAFWENLNGKEESRLQDPQQWQAICAFAENCIKRNAFEESYRKQRGLSSQTAVVIPEGGVPSNILLTINKS